MNFDGYAYFLVTFCWKCQNSPCRCSKLLKKIRASVLHHVAWNVSSLSGISCRREGFIRAAFSITFAISLILNDKTAKVISFGERHYDCKKSGNCTRSPAVVDWYFRRMSSTPLMSWFHSLEIQ